MLKIIKKKTSAGISSDQNLKMIKKTLAGNAGRGRATATPIPTARGSSYVATTTADPRGDSGTQRMTAARKGNDFFLVLYLQFYYYYFVSVFVSD